MIDLLPLGTVCKISAMKADVMIIGYFMDNDETKETYLYRAIPYPYGILRYDKCISFNTKDIEKIIYKGFENIEFQAFQLGVNAALLKK